MDTCTKLYATQLAIEGKTHTQIAQRLGVSSPTVSRNLDDEQIKAKIDYCRNIIATEMLDKAVDNVKHVIDNYMVPIASDDKAAMQLRDHGIRMSQKVMESVGLLPANSVAPVNVNILTVNNNQYISPVVDQLLSSMIVPVDTQDVVCQDNDSDDDKP